MDAPINVFVLDDEYLTLEIITAFLDRFASSIGQDINIRTQTDAVKGLFELTTHGDQYQAILLDVRLPKLTGDEIYDTLAYVNPSILKRIMFVTSSPEDLCDRLPERKLSILKKPFQYEDFAKNLSSVLGMGNID